VTYDLPPDEQGREIHDPEVVERDFGRPWRRPANLVLPYLSDGCSTWRNFWHGLYVMVGLLEQHVDFLATGCARRYRASRDAVRMCSHPALLCYAIGNETAPIVRWLAHAVVERFLKRLYDAAGRRRPGSAGHLCKLSVHGSTW